MQICQNDLGFSLYTVLSIYYVVTTLDKWMNVRVVNNELDSYLFSFSFIFIFFLILVFLFSLFLNSDKGCDITSCVIVISHKA